MKKNTKIERYINIPDDILNKLKEKYFSLQTKILLCILEKTYLYELFQLESDFFTYPFSECFKVVENRIKEFKEEKIDYDDFLNIMKNKIKENFFLFLKNIFLENITLTKLENIEVYIQEWKKWKFFFQTINKMNSFINFSVKKIEEVSVYDIYFKLKKVTEDDSALINKNSFKPKDINLDDYREKMMKTNENISGFISFDLYTKLLGGYYIIAGRPHTGKTSFALQLAYNLLTKNIPVTWISLELSKENVMTRIIGKDKRINLKFGEIMEFWKNDENYKFFSEIKEEYDNLDIYIEDEPLQVDELIFKIEKNYLEYNCKFFFIDYIQLVKENKGKKYYNKGELIDEVSKKIKALTVKYPDIRIFVLSQINREIEGTRDKRPHTYHLKHSGALEEDADVIILLYRPRLYDKDSSKKDVVEFNIEKNKLLEFLGTFYCTEQKANLIEIEVTDPEILELTKDSKKQKGNQSSSSQQLSDDSDSSLNKNDNNDNNNGDDNSDDDDDDNLFIKELFD